MDATPSHNPSTPPSPTPPESTSRPDQRKPPSEDSPTAGKAKAMSIKQEDNESSILDSLDTGYESDAPPKKPLALQTETQLELEFEKQQYPGASTWAPDEEQLFEILFRRAERGILPGHWEVDFRGIPMLDTVFSVNDDVRPIVYSRSGKDFQATMALLRLIDLTSSVRTTVQSGLRQKAPPLIKKSLDRYLSWAAEDGGYSHLRYVPNIITAELDASLEESEITSMMEQRMRALALLQREFLRVDRDDDFWAVQESSGTLVDGYMGRIANGDADADADADADDELVYRRKPPVVYGLFILRSSVFLLTVDSAKGADAYVSFHVDMHFMDRHQSVWNALTVAIAVCLARDQLVRRVEDFEESPDVQGSESD